MAYYSKKMNDEQRRYNVYNQELLAIIESFKNWRHYLEGSKYPIRVQTDHANLRYFFTAKTLTGRQARWAELLAAYDFKIEYRPGRQNAADAPSRRSDYMPSESTEDRFGMLPTLQKKLALGACNLGLSAVNPQVEASVENAEDLTEDAGSPDLLVSRLLVVEAASGRDAYEPPAPKLLELIKQLQERDAFSVETIRSASGMPADRGGSPDTRWRVDSDGLLRRQGAVYVPQSPAVTEELMRMHHDDPYSGHFGQARTLDLLQRKYYWTGMGADVERYTKTCQICQLNRVPRHKPYGQLASLPIPKGPGEDYSMDFIVDLPPSRWRGEVYDSILVVVDRYTKLAIYIPTRKTLDAEQLADAFADKVLSRLGTPKSIVTDRGSLFTSKFWGELCHHMRIRRRLSTAFHPQTDGQTERQNQTLEHYLRAFANHRQDDWASLLTSAEFAYNNSKHSSTQVTPFRALMGYDPRAPIGDDWEGDSSNVSVNERLNSLQEVRKQLSEILQQAVETQAKYYDKRHKPMTFAVEDQVLLSTKNLKTWRPSKKLDQRFAGPFTIVEAVGKQAYRLRLPKTYGRIHPVFHVSLLEPYKPRDGEEPPKPQPVVVDGADEWYVEALLNRREWRGKTQYLVKWEGWPAYENSWQSIEDLSNAREAIEEYDAKHPLPKPAKPKGRKRGRPRKKK